MLVRDCMTTDAKLVNPDTTVREAAQTMRDNDCGFLPVGADDRLQGVVTDRDIVIRGLVDGADPSRQTVGEVMSDKVLYCYDDRDVGDAAHMLAELRIRRLPVVNRDKNFVGVITLGDIAERAASSDTEAQATVGETLHRIAAA